jgi:hypothetical protein
VALDRLNLAAILIQKKLPQSGYITAMAININLFYQPQFMISAIRQHHSHFLSQHRKICCQSLLCFSLFLLWQRPPYGTKLPSCDTHTLRTMIG